MAPSRRTTHSEKGNRVDASQEPAHGLNHHSRNSAVFAWQAFAPLLRVASCAGSTMTSANGSFLAAEVLADTYRDSVRLLEAARSMRDTDGVQWATALMATPANLEALAAEGFTPGAAPAGDTEPDSGLQQLRDAKANDLVLAARATDVTAAGNAIDAGRSVLFATSAAPGGGGGEEEPEQAAAGIAAAVAQFGANLAVISLPGQYAALQAHKALTGGCHVLLFSDNVSLGDEIDLKRRARSLGLLVMGPGAGTAMLGGVGLGFANRVSAGPVGVVAAAGTGAQEVMSLLEQAQVGVSGVVGVGGRDVSEAVGGLMAAEGLRAFDLDPGTETILFVSKPPSPEVAARLLDVPRNKPLVAALMGIDTTESPVDGAKVCATLEQGVTLTLENLKASKPDRVGLLEDQVAAKASRLTNRRSRLVGLFSGGTLCYEAMTVASRHIGTIHSNTPLRNGWGLPAPEGAHVCLDLGEEEYTQGRPHPMIDPAARLDLLAEAATDPGVAVVILDVVLGDGSHHDPAGVLAPVAAQVVESGAAVVAYVLGTERDPQTLSGQQQQLREAGCIVPRTSARAALAAAALVNRDPSLVHTL